MRAAWTGPQVVGRLVVDLSLVPGGDHHAARLLAWRVLSDAPPGAVVVFRPAWCWPDLGVAEVLFTASSIEVEHDDARLLCAWVRALAGDRSELAVVA